MSHDRSLGWKLMDQDHFIIQHDSFIRLHRKRLTKLNETIALSNKKRQELSALQARSEEKAKELNELQITLMRFDQIKEQARGAVKYNEDYKSRQMYYIKAIETISEASLDDLTRRIIPQGKERTRIIVSPDGIRLQEGRSKALLRQLASQKTICFMFDDSICEDIKEESKGSYLFKSEPLLLRWLMNMEIKPVVLSNWVLQAAWYDLLPEKTIWYDICDDENILWGLDAESRLQHFERLRTATLVTYSDRRWKKYAAMRKNAVFLPLYESEKTTAALETVFGGNLRREERSKTAVFV